MNAGLYIHFPFCKSKCIYCDFYSIVAKPELVERYLKNVLLEADLYSRHEFFSTQTFQTIYIGGGTPSLLTPEQLSRLLEFLQDKFQFDNDVEITVEVNPESSSAEKLAVFYKNGVNRLSIGVQSFIERELQLLGRIHNMKTAVRCIRYAQEIGYKNINIDLIFGIPGQSLAAWNENVNQALSFCPRHISMYGLTIESGTSLEKLVKQGIVKPVAESLEKEMYQSGVELLCGAGYDHYEISNLAKPSFYSRHNSLYWDGVPYLGLGAAAHSFFKETRQWNFDDVNKYNMLLSNKILPIKESEQLTQQQQLIEFIMLRLRKKEGISFEQFRKKFKQDFQERYSITLKKLAQIKGGMLIEMDENSLRLTLEGMLFYNEVCSYFI